MSKSFYDLRCNDCEIPVSLSSETPLTEENLKELQARLVCNPCLKKNLEAKK